MSSTVSPIAAVAVYSDDDAFVAPRVTSVRLKTASIIDRFGPEEKHSPTHGKETT
jgi:hypothetical protein